MLVNIVYWLVAGSTVGLLILAIIVQIVEWLSKNYWRK